MVDKSFVPDTKEDLFYISLSLVVLFLFVTQTTLDGQVRALFREKVGYFSSPEANLTFTEEQVDNLNDYEVVEWWDT